MPQIVTNYLPLGTPGDITRDIRESTVEAQYMSTALPLVGYGLPAKFAANGQITGIVAGDAGTAPAGFLVREFPALGGATFNQPFQVSTPPLQGIVGLLRKGYICVKLNAGVAAKEAPVYVRVGAAAAGKPIGGIEAAADGANTVVIPLAFFTGPADAEGNAEVRYNV